MMMRLGRHSVLLRDYRWYIFVSCAWKYTRLKGYRESSLPVCSSWTVDLSINVTHIRNCHWMYLLRYDLKSFSFTDGNSSPIPWNPPLSVKREILERTWFVGLDIFFANRREYAARRRAVYLWTFIRPALFFDPLLRVISRSSFRGTIERERLSRLKHYQFGFLSMSLSISFYAIPWHRISELSVVAADYECLTNNKYTSWYLIRVIN